MSLMQEYIRKINKDKWDRGNFQQELTRLIKEYNKIRGTYLLIYASAIAKPVEDKALSQEDYYIIHDILSKYLGDKSKLDFYLETPGGSGEVAEEIVGFLHSKFKNISFVISGQAKSAGTIMVLSAHEIYMTETGSLGPIDAQIKIGRSTFSAFDYIEWVKEKSDEAQVSGRLNPFDATMIAQITPGELSGVLHSLKYAEDLVIQWLPKYKFGNWNTTESGKPVTKEYKEQRAREIAGELINHAKWRSHGRSLKIDDLIGLGLKINRLEDNPRLADVVFRIQIVIRFLFDMSAIFKIFATADNRIFRQAKRPAEFPGQIKIPVAPISLPKNVDSINFDITCNQCGNVYPIYAKLKQDPKIDQAMRKKGRIPYPKDNMIKCQCGAVLDLLPVRRQFEGDSGKKIVL